MQNIKINCKTLIVNFLFKDKYKHIIINLTRAKRANFSFRYF